MEWLPSSGAFHHKRTTAPCRAVSALSVAPFDSMAIDKALKAGGFSKLALFATLDR